MFPYGTARSPSADPPLRHSYPQFILFGDSITQASEYSFAAPLQDNYIRRLDVVNRGFSGYTSPLALQTLPRFFPTPSQAHVRVMTVFFGANDACLPGSVQHVPLEKYVACLKGIVEHEVVRQHGTQVILIVPAPVDEWQLENGQRTAEGTKKYADACRSVGRELNLPVVDLWSLFMKAAGWEETEPLMGCIKRPRSDALARLLSDGESSDPIAESIWFIFDTFPRTALHGRRLWDDASGVEQSYSREFTRGNSRKSAMHLSRMVCYSDKILGLSLQQT